MAFRIFMGLLQQNGGILLDSKTYGNPSSDSEKIGVFIKKDLIRKKMSPCVGLFFFFLYLQCRSNFLTRTTREWLHGITEDGFLLLSSYSLTIHYEEK